ncbi:MAG: winged helix DNA-binding domain-containing protein, partial [Chloroflexota bacterium]|nr:winged helix DNA-binding domain-containing protein [Chloroflexota bacterium]
AGPRYALRDELPMLDAARIARRGRRGVSFVAPLDPLLWDRRQLREVFGFEYLWEVYVPEPKRRWGYFVLPILFGERLVGRIEPRVERAMPGVVRILRLAFEPTFEPLAEPGFVDAFREAITAYRAFVGASRVEWPGDARADRVLDALTATA